MEDIKNLLKKFATKEEAIAAIEEIFKEDEKDQEVQAKKIPIPIVYVAVKKLDNKLFAPVLDNDNNFIADESLKNLLYYTLTFWDKFHLDNVNFDIIAIKVDYYNEMVKCKSKMKNLLEIEILAEKLSSMFKESVNTIFNSLLSYILHEITFTWEYDISYDKTIAVTNKTMISAIETLRSGTSIDNIISHIIANKTIEKEEKEKTDIEAMYDDLCIALGDILNIFEL